MAVYTGRGSPRIPASRAMSHCLSPKILISVAVNPWTAAHGPVYPRQIGEVDPTSREVAGMRKVQVVLQDDIDGGEPARTVHFSYEGKAYEIDLTEQNAVALRDALAPWINAARPESSAQIPSPRSMPRRSADTVDIRRWAKENHIPVRDRGRLPSDLRSRYEAAH